METTRQQKVSRLLQKEIGGLFQQEIKDLCMGKMLTVTVVRVSADFSVARVYISIFPSEGIDELLFQLNDNYGRIRNELGKKIRHQLKQVPELKFFQDDSLDYIDNIDDILSKK
jgi:ribosome-binding factor A